MLEELGVKAKEAERKLSVATTEEKNKYHTLTQAPESLKYVFRCLFLLFDTAIIIPSLTVGK